MIFLNKIRIFFERMNPDVKPILIAVANSVIASMIYQLLVLAWKKCSKIFKKKKQSIKSNAILDAFFIVIFDVVMVVIFGNWLYNIVMVRYVPNYRGIFVEILYVLITLYWIKQFIKHLRTFYKMK
jgi:hypothetical protein